MTSIFKKSLKVEILLRTGLLAFLAIVLIIGFNFYSTGQLILQNTDSLLARQGKLATERINEYIRSTNEFQNQIVDSFSGKVVQDAASEKAYMTNSIKNVRNISGMHFLKSNGSYTMAYELKPKSSDQLFFQMAIPESSKMVWIEGDIYNKEVSVEFLTMNKKLIKRVDRVTLNQDLILHEPLVENQRKSVHNNDITKRLIYGIENKIDAGVLKTYVDLKSLSYFLNEIQPSQNTRMLIIDHQKTILADSELAKDSIGKSMAKIPNKTFLEFIKYEEKLKSGVMQKVTIGGENYYYLMISFPKNTNLDWRIVMIAQEKDFIGELLKQEKNTILIATFLLAIMLIILFFQMTFIAEPVTSVSVEARKIAKLDLDDDFVLKSSVQEIEDMSSAVQNMKHTITNLSKFVPKSLVQRLNHAHKKIEIGGESSNITLMFSDIQGFSTISEKMEPEALALHISEYFQELTEIILDNHGTVDKFIGDAIMTFWGAPDADKDQILHACQAALLCKQRLDALNKYWKAEGKPILITRFGIHGGTCVVGNVGSDERMSYTALGDNVNLSARLEGANKNYDTYILISKDIERFLPDNFIRRSIDNIAVKGKSNGIEVFELIGVVDHPVLLPVSQDKIDYAKQFSAMVDLYREKSWKEALKMVAQLRATDIGKDDTTMLDLYQGLCQELIANPPSADWDGVRHLKEK